MAGKYDIPVPKWGMIAGTTSYFDHPTQTIALSQVVIDSSNEKAIRYLVAHEFQHWNQWYTNRLQGFRSLREIDADRAARDEVSGRSRILPLFDRPTPFIDSLATEFDMEPNPLHDLCEAHTCLSCQRKVRKFGRGAK